MRATRITVGLLATLLMLASTADAAVNVTLEDAIRQNKVKVNVQSLGGATGNGVRVDVQSLVGEELRVQVEPGTVLLNASAKHQNLGVGALKGELSINNTYIPGKVMVLADRKRHSFLLEIFCLDAAKPDPSRGTSLKVAVKDSRVARILAAAPTMKASIWATQLAIWIDRSGITIEKARQLHPGKISEVDVKVARRLVKKAEADGVEEIPKEMPADVRVQVTQLYSPKPAVRAMAAETLGGMGPRARVALPFLTQNILDRSTDKPLPVNVVAADEEPKDLGESLEALGLPGLAPLLNSLAQTDGKRTKKKGLGGFNFKVPGLKGLNIKVPGVEIKNGEIRVEGDQAVPARKVMIETLLPRLESESAAVRERAAWLLGTLREREAVTPLIEMLEHADQDSVQAAAEALEAITGCEFGAKVAEWQSWWKEHKNDPVPQQPANDDPDEAPAGDTLPPPTRGESLPPPTRRDG